MAEPSVEERIEGVLAMADGDVPQEERKDHPEEVAEPEEGAVEPEVEAETDSSQEEEIAEPEDVSEEDMVPEDFAEWARYNDLAPEDLYGLKFNVHMNGEQKHVTLGQMKDAYTQVEHDRQEAMRAASEHQAKIESMQRAEATYFQRLREADALNYAAEQALLGQFNDKEMQELRQSDPGEYAARAQEYQRKLGEIQQYRTALAQAVTQQQQQFDQQRQQQFSEAVKAAEGYLQSIDVEWKDPMKASAKKAAIREYLLGLNFQENELEGIADPRFILVAEDAAKYRQLMKGKSEAEKAKITKSPRLVMKPGAKRTKASLSKDQYSKDKARLRKSGGSSEAAVDFIERYFAIGIENFIF